MTKRFTVDDRWIKDNCIGILLNIDFNTITDANLCCDLLNQIEKEKMNNGKLTSKLLEEHRRIIDLLDKKLQENDDNDEYVRRVKIDLIMELKKELQRND